jgi:hypothetical protein
LTVLVERVGCDDARSTVIVSFAQLVPTKLTYDG